MPLVTDETLFSRAVVVESAAPREIVNAVLAGPAARVAVLGVLKAGYRSITIDVARGVLSTQVICHQGESLADHVAPVLPVLAKLTAALPIFEGGRTWRGRAIDWLAPLLGFLILICGLLLVLIGMLYWEPEGLTAFWMGAVWGLPAWALLTGTIFLLIRGRSGGIRSFAPTVLSLLLGLPALVAGGAIVVNARLDRSPATTQTVSILQKEKRSDRKGTRHLLRVRSWRRDRTEPEFLEVSEAQYADAREGQQIHVRIREGRLGWRWMEGWSLGSR